MRFMSERFFLMATLLFVTAAEAESNNPPAMSRDPVAPTPMPRSPDVGAATADLGENPGVNDVVRGSGRYGIGFDARQGIGSGEQGSRSGRPERAGRGDRGGRER